MKNSPAVCGRKLFVGRIQIKTCLAAQSFRDRTLSLTCIASLARLPQVTLPAEARVNGCPVGLSLIGPRGSDRALLGLAAQLTQLS